MKPSPQAGRLLQSLGHKHVPHFPPRRNFVAIPSHRRAPKLYPARTQIPSQSHIPFKPFHPYLSILYAAVTFPFLEFTPNQPMRKLFFLKISITWYFLNTKSHVFAIAIWKRRLIALHGNGQSRCAAHCSTGSCTLPAPHFKKNLEEECLQALSQVMELFSLSKILNSASNWQ